MGKRDLKGQGGQSAVEFALILPVLILIVLGIIEFGWLLNSKITLTSASREGARVAIVTDDEDRVKTAIKNHVEGLSGFKFSGAYYYESKSELDAVNDLPKYDATGNLTDNVAVAVESQEVTFEDNGEEMTEVQIIVHMRGFMKPLLGLLVSDPSELRCQATMRKE
ncbi:MAG: pilus assembly protein [Candidatus Desulforudis sp.]|nr:pilus assembly protein [Desulforudis sp.]